MLIHALIRWRCRYRPHYCHRKHHSISSVHLYCCRASLVLWLETSQKADAEKTSK